MNAYKCRLLLPVNYFLETTGGWAGGRRDWPVLSGVFLEGVTPRRDAACRDVPVSCPQLWPTSNQGPSGCSEASLTQTPDAHAVSFFYEVFLFFYRNSNTSLSNHMGEYKEQAP